MLQVEPEEVVPEEVDLVFRRHGVRRMALPQVMARVCPEQDGIVRPIKVTCEQCQLCIRPVVLASGLLPDAVACS